jgi:hypothetical protein
MTSKSIVENQKYHKRIFLNMSIVNVLKLKLEIKADGLIKCSHELWAFGGVCECSKVRFQWRRISLTRDKMFRRKKRSAAESPV